MFIHRIAALLVLALLASAGPAAAQGGESSSADAPVRGEANASVDAKMPALLPPPCLACDAALRNVRDASVLEAEALPRGVAPLIGGVVGAAVGFVAMRVACANRSCEMEDLVGILGGAVIGSAIGRQLEGSLRFRDP